MEIRTNLEGNMVHCENMEFKKGGFWGNRLQRAGLGDCTSYHDVSHIHKRKTVGLLTFHTRKRGELGFLKLDSPEREKAEGKLLFPFLRCRTWLYDRILKLGEYGMFPMEKKWVQPEGKTVLEKGFTQ